MKSIPTTHNGIKFRSRTEARWAVFLEVLKIKFDYEPDGFDLDGLFYLPDFWLPKQEIWLEIKPVAPNATEQEKAFRLANHTKKNVLIQAGSPSVPDLNYDQNQIATCHFPGHQQDFPCYWTRCDSCGAMDMAFDGRTERLKCACPDRGPRYNFEAPELIMAYGRAASHEFWNPTE